MPSLNGGWPELPAVPPAIVDLPVNASPIQLARAYATAFMSFAPLWRKVVEALEYLKAKQEEHEIAHLELPPMRRRADSSGALAEYARHARQEGEIAAQEIVDDPNSNLTPETVGGIIEAKVSAALTAHRDADRRAQLEAAERKRLADEEQVRLDERERAKERRDFRRNIVIAVIGGAFVLAAAGYGVFMQGRETGHGEGFAERAAVAPAILPVPVPVLPAETASAVPATKK